MWTDAAREAARLAKAARDSKVGIGSRETADSVPNYPVRPHDQQQSAGTHDSMHGGRLGLNPVLAAMLGIGSGLATSVLRPALRGRGGRRGR
jgi:hypothetical protein